MAAKIIVPCPTTGAVVATGQHATPTEFDRAELQGLFSCSSCGRVHAWTKGEVSLTAWPGATSLQGL